MKYLTIILLLYSFSTSYSQQRVEEQKRSHVLRAKVIDGDTVFMSDIPEVNVYSANMFKNRWEEWRYSRLVRNVKAAYPYAKLAGIKLLELDQELVSIENEKKRKELVKTTEKKIRDEFEAEVRKLTITQGRILIKLIDRETGNTTYQVLQNIKGNVSAVFWQAIARIFGSNLKSEYDPYGEDAVIEMIIFLIETGQL